MEIGKKIKNIRVEKLMTQSELSGDLITRNMLSQIENGTAQPSLTTVFYLAQRLGVPAGYLLSEGEEEFVYSKIRVMKNIKKAYLDRSFEWCREMCLTSFDEFDDELELILTDCCIGTAEEHMRNGRLYLARDMLDEALIHSRNTIYSTVAQRNRAYIMFYFMKGISPSLDSNEADTDLAKALAAPELFEDIFCKYLAIICKQNETGELCELNGSLRTDSSHDRGRHFIEHINAKKCMQLGDYESASDILRSMMDSDDIPERLLLYFCCEDMEKCCKETGDYKGAYEFSGNKLEILEHMLVEV